MIEEYILKLKDILSKIVQEKLKNEKNVGVSYSGGIDSSIIAFLCSKYADVTLYCVGMKNSYDISTVEQSAKMINIENITKITLNENDIRDNLLEIINITGEKNLFELSFIYPIYFVCKESKDEIIFSGHGADELFGGYQRYTRLDNKKLKIALKKDIIELKTKKIIREKNICKYFGKKIVMPYLHDEFIEFCLSIPTKYLIKQEKDKIVRKYALRELAVAIDIPYDIAYKDKKAAQYSSGIAKSMKKIFCLRNLS